MQTNLYLSDPSLCEISAVLTGVRPTTDGTALATEQNIFRPHGGGEPADRGEILLECGTRTPVLRVEKTEGATWIVVPPVTLAAGQRVVCRVDAAYRERKRRLHTLVHVTLATATRRFHGISVESAEIALDAGSARISVAYAGELGDADFFDLDRSVRSIVLSSRRVVIDKVKSLDHARSKYGDIFRISERHQLSGKVRIVVIEEIDANPCSGTHFETTAVGPYELTAMPWDKPNRFAISLILRKAWSYWYGEQNLVPEVR